MTTTGLDNLPQTRAALEQGMADGLHVGAQVYVSRHGQPVADGALGQARPGAAMTPDTLMLWMSATKPVAAVAVGQLWERGLLDLDDPVANHIPEFAANGKGRVTIRHLLTHTGGFRAVTGDWEQQPWDAIIAAICAARPEPGWEPGRKAGYHPATSWYVLGELVRRLDGRPFDRYVREAIFEPLGMHDSWGGMPPERYRAYGQRIGLMHRTDGDTPRADLADDTEDGAAACRPGRNGRGPARELGRFYEVLLAKGRAGPSPQPSPGGRGSQNELPPLLPPLPPGEGWGEGVRVLNPQTVEALTARHRAGAYDHTFKAVIDWGLGFLLESGFYRDNPDPPPYGYGPHASRRTFGHSGSQSSAAFADPEHGLAVAVIFNGMPGEATHQRRIRQVLAAVYQDLGLAQPTEA